ncbi:MAG TPA: hypothetical protein VJ436_02445 [Anaerolineales bacterium]|nr:hypothetical protein [Anaerolineales bacterium]
MSRQARVQEFLDPSTEAMLAEHERLSNLYLNNSEMGERRTTLFFTVFSGGLMVMVAIAQLDLELMSIYSSAVVFLSGMLGMGILTFVRLIERRTRAIEYLRAINRIHRYFVKQDPSLNSYYYWQACDDIPPFKGKEAALRGLIDIVAVINSLILGGIVCLLGIIYLPDANFRILSITIGIIVGGVTWWPQFVYESKSLARAEHSHKKFVLYPKTELDKVEELSDEVTMGKL